MNIFLPYKLISTKNSKNQFGVKTSKGSQTKRNYQNAFGFNTSIITIKVSGN